MGQKVNPISIRLGINQFWSSNWYSKKNFSKNLNNDLRIRKTLLKKYKESNIASIYIERFQTSVTIKIYSALPYKIRGKGEGLKLIERDIKNTIEGEDKNVRVEVITVKKPNTNATLCALNIGQKIEKRVPFRKAMKQIINKAMRNENIIGIKTQVSGRLNGADIATKEWYMEGQVPLHTLRSNIDYGTSEISTIFGLIGIKIWIHKICVEDN